MIRQSMAVATVPPLAEEITRSLIRDAHFMGVRGMAEIKDNVWISRGQEARLVDFEQILTGGDFLRNARICWRYILFKDKEAKVALAVVDIELNGGRQVLRCTRIGPAVEEIPDILRRVGKISEKEAVDYVVRFVEIAAMQLDLIWSSELVDGVEGGGKSYFIPLSTSAGFDKGAVYPEDLFKLKLIKAAHRQRSQRRPAAFLISESGNVDNEENKV